MSAVAATARKRRTRMSFSEFFEGVYEPKYLQRKARGTQQNERYDFKAYLRELGPRMIGAIKRDDIQELLEGKGYNVKVSIRTTAANVLGAAQAEKYLPLNVPLATDSLVIPRPHIEPPPILTLAEIQEVYRRLDRPVRELLSAAGETVPVPTQSYQRQTAPVRELLLLVCSGAAIREALGSCVRHYNLGLRLATLQGKSLQPQSVALDEIWDVRNGPGKPRRISDQKQRVIPLACLLCELLATYLDGRTKWRSADDFMFVSQYGPATGKPFNSNNLRERYLRSVEKELGIDNVTWMCLRHSGATLLERIGLNAAERAWLYGTRLDAIAGGRCEVIDHDRVRDGVNKLVECIALGRELQRISGSTVSSVGQVIEQATAANLREGGVIPVPPGSGKSRNERLLEFVKLNDCKVMDVWRSAQVHPPDGTQWRNDRLGDDSEKSRRIEKVLRAERQLYKGIEAAKAAGLVRSS